MSQENDKYQVLPNGKKILKNASLIDIILSIIIPIFGLIIGIYALIKGEKKRGFTLLGIFALCCVIQFIVIYS
jgi:PTS system, mannose/fructose/sorbose family, IID component